LRREGHLLQQIDGAVYLGHVPEHVTATHMNRSVVTGSNRKLEATDSSVPSNRRPTNSPFEFSVGDPEFDPLARPPKARRQNLDASGARPDLATMLHLLDDVGYRHHPPEGGGSARSNDDLQL
jgi:hypothetical protein